MKKSDLFKIGVLLVATTLGTTGCSFGEDEKKRVGGQAVLGSQLCLSTPCLTKRHGSDPT